MVPTYFRRELRDRVLQRHLRLRAFCFLPPSYCVSPPHPRHTPRKVGHPVRRCVARVHERLWNTGSPALAGGDGEAGDESEMLRRMSNTPARASKAELRAATLAMRDALDDTQRDRAALAIAARGLPIEIPRGTVVSGYSPIKNELDPFPLLRKLAAKGARLALPAVMARGKSLVFRAWSVDDRLLLGPLGILEPSPAAAELVPDIMLVPLAAFDRLGHRIGYGAGHYDHTLAHLRKVKAITAIGLGFAAQEIEMVPALPHDVALDYVLTETRVFDFRS
jgi:5-formyltetrahydrofolate cyclo-ligase